MARITGNVVADVKAHAYFVVAPRPSPINLTVFSQPEITILIIWQGPELPTTGTYDVGTSEAPPVSRPGFHALYFVPAPINQSYVSQSGRLTITEATATRMAGSFRLIAKRYCEQPGYGCTPLDVPPNAPDVTIDGWFIATVARPQQPRVPNQTER